MAHAVVESLVWLMGIAAIAAMLIGQRNVPYTVVLVLAGLALRGFHYTPALEFSPPLLLLGFLPALLFEAAWSLSLAELRATLLPVTLLAVIGVAIATGLEAAALVVGGILPWRLALLFGAIVAPTDPVAVVATFRRLGMPVGLTTLVDAESLFNDGTAMAIFQVALAGLAVSGPPSALGALGTFAGLVVGGLVTGAGTGAIASWLLILADDALVGVTLTVVAAYGAYLAAEALHASPILSVIACALMVRAFGRPRGMTPETQLAADRVWEFAAFLANSLVFLLMGAELDLGRFAPLWPAILIAYAAMLIARALTVYPLSWVANRIAPAVPLVWQHVLVWGSLRGALSMALVLSLPADTPARGTLITLVFGVVLLSLLIQGTTIGPWIKRAPIAGPEAHADREARQA